jgi:thiamine kinase-like enzyme
LPDSAIERDVEQILATVPVFATQPGASWSIFPLASLTNRVCRIAGPGGDFVLRLANPAPYLDRTREAHNHRLAADLGLAPPILFEDATSGVMVTGYLANHRSFGGYPDRAAGIAAVGRTLKRLQSSGAEFVGGMRFTPTMDLYLEIAGRGGKPIITVWQCVRPLVEPVLGRIEQTLVPSHVDPAPENLLLAVSDHGPVVRLIDWEYSAPAAAVWDLADFSIEANLDQAEDELLLGAYAGEAAASIAPSFRLYKAMLDLLAAAWAASQAALHGVRKEHGGMIEGRLARSLGIIEAPDFPAIVAAAADAY